MDFKQLGLQPQILSALEKQGYKTPSPIQEKAIPPALAGRDVLGCAQTGTGKTCAFATPILQRLNQTARKNEHYIRALILTPTRELALQIQESFVDYGRNLPLRSTVIFGGVGQGPQVDKLRKGMDILVATPGRLLDLQGQGLVDLSRLEIFVLDEADRMLDMGFIHDVRRVLKVLPAKKQTLFFSATMPPEVTALVNALLHDPVKVAVDPVSSPVEVIAQSVCMVDRGNKTKLLALLMDEHKAQRTLVFTRTKHGANRVVEELKKLGIKAAAIHGNKSQTARQQALADFKAKKIKALVATDIAARGIDIEELSFVVNYNLPEVPETYIHRIGRTGRAGHSGTAVSLCEFGEKAYLKDIERLIGKPLAVWEGNPWNMENFDVTKDKRGKTVNPEDAEARQAARERKKERDLAKKNAPASKAPKQKEQTPKRQNKPAPKVESAPASKTTNPQPKSRRGVRHNKLEDTMPRESAPVEPTDRRPDPLAGSVIMDATARLLAPRRREAPKAPQNSAPKKAPNTAQKKQSKPAQKAAPAPQPKENAPKNRNKKRNNFGRPPRVELRKGNQKDSTEQESLIKPYYINQDR